MAPFTKLDTLGVHPPPKAGFMWSQHLERLGKITLCEVPIPEPGPSDLVVAVKIALTCGTDIKTYRRGHPVIRFPGPLGHEFSGEVAAAGPDVKGFKVGDRIASVHTAPCDRCPACLKGRPNLCAELGNSMVLGAYAQYLRLPETIHRRNAFLMPDHLSHEDAALLEPLACVVQGMNRLAIHPGLRAVVIGAGSIGLLFLQSLKAAGIHDIAVLGRRAMRLEAARSLGASLVVDVEQEDPRATVLDWSNGQDADLVVECTGRPDVWKRTTEIVSDGGEILLFGGCPEGTEVAFDASKLHYGEVKLHGAFHFRPSDVQTAFELLRTGAISAQPLITETISLFDLQEGFQRLIAGEAIKLAIDPAIRQAQPKTKP